MSYNPLTYIFDASALIAFFNGENGNGVVSDLLKKSKQDNTYLYLHAINLYEVYYDCLRSTNKERANEILKMVHKLPIKIEKEIDETLIEQASIFKVNEKISLADSILLGLAVKKKGIVVTADHHEFDVIEEKNILRFQWIR